MVKVNGKIIPLTHTVCASAAFLVTLCVSCILHYDKIVKNSFFGYPDEWFPSVSAAIGDHYPERSIFQILIATTAFSRFLLLLGHYYLNRSLVALVIGLLRTFSCGGWVYITSTDNHDAHDVFMILYIVLTLPWDICVIRSNAKMKTWRKIVTFSFFGTIIPLVRWFVKHRIDMVAGAYSVYSIFEWLLIAQDITFDALAYADFKVIEISLDNNQLDSTHWFIKHTSSDNAPTNLPDSKLEEPLDEKMDSDLEVKEDIEDNEENITVLYPPHSFAPCQSYIYILSNTFNSFMFWTAVTSLTCCIWYFPLWYMKISGYESAMAYHLGPVLLFFPFMPKIIHQYGVLLGGLIMVGAHLVGTPQSRLLVDGAGTSILVTAFVLNLKSIRKPEVNAAFTVTWLLGLVISVVLKFACHGNSPLWPIIKSDNGGYHKSGLVFVTIFGILAPYTNAIHFSQRDETKEEPSQSHRGIGAKVLIALGFGSLMFGIHQLMTDSSTLIYWSWEGWNQDTMGPLAWPWSGLTCLVMLFAAVTSLKFAKNVLFPCILLVEATVVLCNRNVTEWNNYIYGGLTYVVAIIWMIPSYFAVLSDLNSIIVLVFGLIFYVLISMSSVWVVAYPFVPLGWLLRERIEVVVWTSTICIVLGAFALQPPSYTVSSFSDSSLGFTFFKRIFVVSMVIAAMIGGITYEHKPAGLPQPYHPDAQLITAGIWTVHFGFDNDMWASEEGMIFLLQSMELDVIGLLETDAQRIPMGNRDLTSKLAHRMNMYADYGPGPNKHTWGCALLSKFPIVNSTHHLLPSPQGELAPAIQATLRTYNDTLVDVFVFHSGQEEDELDRQLQTETMARLMAATPRPTILLSYLVTKPHEGNYNTYVSEETDMHDIDPSDHERWCEYILYKNLNKIGYARVSRGKITDTELQVGKFQVLPESQVSKMGKSLYDTVIVDDAEEEYSFPDKFSGEGERNHFYHVFEEPRYYKLES
ncbi:probable protein CWH43 [Zygosaccharomyces bailii]|nr:probable protein CWH43 [Zygosaccharomyces bailii]